MKVTFLIHSLEAPSSRYRVLQYLPYLKNQGVDGGIHFYKRKWFDKLNFYNTLSQYDIFFIHRKLFSPLEFWYIRQKAKKIIYDFDDALMYRSSGSKSPYSFSRRVKFAYMIRRVDYVIAGNQFLKSEVLPYNPHVIVIPTAIDLSRYSLKEHFSKVGPITIGWLGSSSTLKYLKTLMPIFENLYKKYPNLQLKIVCDQFLDSLNIPLIKKRWSSDEEEVDLKSFDIGLMPLVDDPWSWGKCGLKIIQYQGVGLPVVCTPVGVNQDLIKDGVNGFWAKTPEEWEEKLSTLIEDPLLREKMGREGRKRVLEAYTIQSCAPHLLSILQGVMERKSR